jgi:hypothetical protein
MALSCVLTCRAHSEARNAVCQMGWRRALHREPFRRHCCRGSRAERISPNCGMFRVLWGAMLSRRVSVFRRFEGPWQQLQVESPTEQTNKF